MTDPQVATYPAAGTLDDVLGFELLEASATVARGRFAVADRVRQPLGLVHGGAYASLAESMTSAATYRSVADEGNVAVGQSNSTSFLRPALEGTVHAEARPLHSGRTTWVWDVEFRDDSQRLCAISRVTIAVRPARQV
jgi:1,4-dihydroxy-2-naphthoyl-CoA hydrolase